MRYPTYELAHSVLLATQSYEHKLDRDGDGYLPQLMTQLHDGDPSLIDGDREISAHRIGLAITTLQSLLLKLQLAGSALKAGPVRHLQAAE